MEQAVRRFIESEHPSFAATAFGFLDRSFVSHREHNPRLISNVGSDTMLAAIKAELRTSQSFTFSVAFVTSQAIATLKQALLDYTGTGTIITSTYLGFNSPGTFRELLNLPNIDVYIHDQTSGFHPKGYIFSQTEATTAIIGSANLTEYALSKNTEWNIRFSAMPDGDIVDQLNNAVEFQLDNAVPLTHAWVEEYECTYVPPAQRKVATPLPEELQQWIDEEPAIVANEMQREALSEIAKVREAGEQRAIVVSATGTGKTILAALDVQAVAPKRLLFVVHREQIIDRAIHEFKRVLREPDEAFGKFVGSVKQLDRKYVFATVQSLSREHVLVGIDPRAYDYILIDEVHRAGAATYQRVIDHFRPNFLLGFTATPERTDGKNLFEIFDYNVPYEIRLQEALSREMLSPFHYYGVTDYETDDGEVISEASDLQQLVLSERIDHIIRAIETYGHVGTRVRGLIFCSRKDEAHQLSAALNHRQIHGARLRTVALTGDDSVESRERAVERLEGGSLDYLITVDVFNEGVDIPSVNQVVMLRNTQSSIIFTQQLGRGLRKSEGKDHLRVIDFIGNYANNFLIPIALFGDNSLNKDSVRRHLRDAEATGVISGISSVNFDEISRQRVFASLADAKLDSMVNLKRTFQNLEFRLGHPPTLLDFARFDAADPVIIATKHRNYWNFLRKVKAVETEPSPLAESILTFLSHEVLAGQRPHEALVIEALLEHGTIRIEQIQKLLSSEGCTTDVQTMESLFRTLDLSFYLEAERKKFGHQRIASREQDVLVLNRDLANLYVSDASFRQHIEDLLATSLYLARHRHGWAQGLVPGYQYSRKTISRFLGWHKQEPPNNVGGYKTDIASGTCPIFVTYHKGDEIAESIRYEDEFIDPSTMLWFSKHSRTITSPDIQRIRSEQFDLHLFVKKDDAEGTDFYYLGEVRPSSAQETTQIGAKGKHVPVVTLDLHLETPVEPTLYEYLTASV